LTVGIASALCCWVEIDLLPTCCVRALGFCLRSGACLARCGTLPSATRSSFRLLTPLCARALRWFAVEQVRLRQERRPRCCRARERARTARRVRRFHSFEASCASGLGFRLVCVMRGFSRCLLAARSPLPPPYFIRAAFVSRGCLPLAACADPSLLLCCAAQREDGADLHRQDVQRQCVLAPSPVFGCLAAGGPSVCAALLACACCVFRVHRTALCIAAPASSTIGC
jgi:hypothetical protein